MDHKDKQENASENLLSSAFFFVYTCKTSHPRVTDYVEILHGLFPSFFCPFSKKMNFLSKKFVYLKKM